MPAAAALGWPGTHTTQSVSAGAPPASPPTWGHLRLGPHPALACPLPWATGAWLKDSLSPDGPPTSASLKGPARPQEAPAQVVAPCCTQASLIPTATALSPSHRTTATRLPARLPRTGEMCVEQSRLRLVPLRGDVPGYMSALPEAVQDGSPGPPAGRSAPTINSRSPRGQTSPLLQTLCWPHTDRNSGLGT